jgi:hypothetical protein
VKWAEGRGVSNSDRMVFYTNDKKYVRFPMVPLMSVPIQYRGLYQLVTYYGKLGALEPVYPETWPTSTASNLRRPERAAPEDLQ